MDTVTSMQANPVIEDRAALPSGWHWVRVRDFEMGALGSVEPSKTPDDSFVLYSVPAFDRRTPDIVKGGHVESNKQYLPANALLVCKINPRINRIWKVRAHTPREGRIIGSTEWIVIRESPALDPDYLRLFLTTERVRQYLVSNVSGVGGSLMRVNANVVGSIVFPLAPLAEQRRIVSDVDALFVEIAEGEAALAEARKGLGIFRRALLKAAVTGELTKDWRATNSVSETGEGLLAGIARGRAKASAQNARARRARDAKPIDTTDLPKLPTSWTWATIRELGDVVGGLTKNPNREKMPAKLPYLRVANVQLGHLDLSEVKEIGVTNEERQRASLQQGDLLIVEGNGSIDQIGRCAIWNGEVAECVHQNHIIKVRFPDSGLSQWCFTWLLSPHGRHEIEQVAASTSGLHTLSISKVESLPIPIPPAAEATEIWRRVSDAIAASADTLAMLDAEAADAARLKQSILKAAFEGRLAPQDPTDEPASTLLARLAADHSAVTAKRRRAKSTRSKDLEFR